MRIILTHEQADFDALASMLAAHLLDDIAVPVLPRRMNRNVQAFLTLYGADLPFVDPRDLPSEAVDAVTLVDTQSMVSIKGMGSYTKVRVIDHHPRRENLPLDWEVTSADTGATTTMLIEELRETNGDLTMIQATLLLMGIYEDTGSLTYSRTNARDLRAAAFLLEQGASLNIASNFLNHPLSPKQQALYDQLRMNAETHHIHGHTIVIAVGDAQDMEEELSSIAHKLRDLLDPDALFLVVTTRGGIQLIARSATDNIDVSAILANFGGGGHERAAASLIRDRQIDAIHTELIDILPRLVHPAITVAQIMSRGPQVLTPSTSVEEAAERMQRYGYEGYPVVQDGKVVGLLTRRAVDRALAHKLTSNAGRLMEAGGVTVQPDDSIERLQRLMTDSGWGQVPVINPETGDIIGIVTRTDLLKILTPQPSLPSRQNLASRLGIALPSPRLALLKAIAQEAHELHAALYIVGGFVRDLLLERPSLDFDLVVEGDAIILARALASRYGGRVTSHARFGTAKWHIGDYKLEILEQIASNDSNFPPLTSDRVSHKVFKPINLPDSLDLVTARTEFYTHPTALPTVERGSIKLDLHRRDFTINTLALRLDGRHYGELHDYWGGLADLHQGLVRVLHSLSFVDDPTRMMRAARFEQRFNFTIEARTLELLREALALLERISGDRIRHELNNIISEEQAPHILARLGELGLLHAIHPDLVWDDWLNSRFIALPNRLPEADWGVPMDISNIVLKRNLTYTIWLMRLPLPSALAISKRLKLPAELVKIAQEACNLWRDLPGLVNLPASVIVARLEPVHPLARFAVFSACSDDQLRSIIDTYIKHWQKISPRINGDELRRRGLPPGPIYRQILEELRNAWLDGKVSSNDEEAALLDKLIVQGDLIVERKGLTP
jgi:tRNA nucleotidyltransferase (CCA-adding enzyme)